MKKLLLAAAISASFLAAGCAAPETTTASAERMDGDVTTGSRIPRKDNPSGTKVIHQDDASRAEITRQSAQTNPRGF